MKRLSILAVLFLAYIPLFAQQPVKIARKKSWQSLVYRIPADTAAKYVRKYTTYPNHYLQQQPFLVVKADSVDHEALPIGNYLIISVIDNELVTEFYCRSNLQLAVINNERKVQLELKDRAGNFLANAAIRVNDKPAPYDPNTKSYWVPQKKPDDALVQVVTPGDTLITDLWEKGNDRKGAWSQWWTNFSQTKVGSVITWPVRSVRKALQWPPSDRNYKNNNKGTGYMVFNKPRYKPLDTVKFKAYIVTKKGKQYRQSLDVVIKTGYSTQSNSNDDETYKIGALKPVSPGAFVHEFILDDSLDSDRQYTIEFRNKKNKAVFSDFFKIEDYLLDEVATYSLSSKEKTYFRNDTLVFTTSAKDANGLPVMDGRVRLYVLTTSISKFYSNRLYVPDTLWQEEKILAIDGDTKFKVPASGFPAADLILSIKAEFLNSNNELQEKQQYVDFIYRQLALTTELNGNYIKANLVMDGRHGGSGWMKKSNSGKPVPVIFPYTEKIDPYTEKYSFFVLDDSGKKIVNKDLAPSYYTVSSTPINSKDTAGFTLYNPYKVPVHYTISYGNRIIATGGDSTETIIWKDIVPVKKAYSAEWQYIWGGRQLTNRQSIGVLDKIMETSISGASTIYPGQIDTITVAVKDYKGNAAENVNLTAVSYNSQFGSSIRVPDPPYLKKYKYKRGIRQKQYETGDAKFTKRFLLGNYPSWNEKFGLDSMTYYKLLFPKDSFHVAHTAIDDFLPQLSVHVIKKGVPQQIYLLYLNRELVYYNGSTNQSNYAFAIMPGYAQVIIRLRDRLIQVDSIYVQPFYKSDVSFDLDNLPAIATVKERPTWYTKEERSVIEQTTWQFESDYFSKISYVWQGSKLVKLDNYYYHRVGPFQPGDSLHFYKPNEFDIKIPFESGYSYSLSPKMARLEKSTVFNPKRKVRLYTSSKFKWITGDTIIPPPVIEYKIDREPRLKMTTNPFAAKQSSAGKLRIELPADSNFIYTVLHRVSGKDTSWVQRYPSNLFTNIEPGLYELILMTSNHGYLGYSDLTIKMGQTYCVFTDLTQYRSSNKVIDKLSDDYARELMNNYVRGNELRLDTFISRQMPLPAGTASITGRVMDEKGKAGIPYATIALKGYGVSALTNHDGTFSINNIRAGSYLVTASSVGYQIMEKWVDASATPVPVNIRLMISINKLQDVVVVGYGTRRRADMSEAITGRVMGLSARNPKLMRLAKDRDGDGVMDYYDDEEPVFSFNTSVRIRGFLTNAGNTKPLIVVDGKVMEELPAGFDMNKAQVSVLKDAEATALYGSRGSNGALIITTSDFASKELRDRFQDYAFWQPNLFTDKDGKVKFTVTYPDNITSWQTFVVGMDKKKRITTSSSKIKSFKPLLAQLSAPQFLIEGDSVAFIGKTTNYSATTNSVRNEFTVNGNKQATTDKQVEANSSSAEDLYIVAGSEDSLSAQYTVVNSTGYKDGELRKIPVLRKGIEETIGEFWILEKDTSLSFIPDKNAGRITIHAENNTLDVLLDELKQLKKYPYYCMEQIASKLTGLAMEKKIRKALNQPFKNEKELLSLLSRLQKSQKYTGGWSWWDGDEPNLIVTNYITRALLHLTEYPFVSRNIQSGVYFLYNHLEKAGRHEKLEILFTLSEAGHMMDYQHYLNMLQFDLLSVHEQWQYIKIKQNRKLDYTKELGTAMQKQIGTMLGGLHWGEDNYWWNRNVMATTVLAYKTLENEKNRQAELKRIIQFFLESRKKGHWTNTVESASIVSAILPAILQNHSTFTSPASLRINNAVTTDKFPFTTTVASADAAVTINKTGGGLLYCTAYQEIFNKNPPPVTDKFRINTWFERSGNNVASLKGGEKVTMKIEVDVTADADYVQIELPIPAGCTYGMKKQSGWNIQHIEYLKDRAIFFVEKLAKGVYKYEVELEPRYSGSYTLNPAKAELMYFPVIFGRNETRKISIKK